MTTITVTLNKANRIAQGISARLKKDTGYNGFSIVTVLRVPTYSDNRQTFEALMLEKNRVEQENKENFAEAIAWVEAKSAVKKAVFKKNVSCGLSDLIEDLEMEKNRLKILEKIHQAVKRGSGALKSEDLSLYLVEGLISNQEEHSGPSISVTVVDLLDDPERIEKEISVTQYKISQINDEMFRLNNTEEVEFLLADKVAERLGLRKPE